MKTHLTIIALVLNSQFAILSSFAAVPLRWTVETSRATPAQFEAYQGEELKLEAAMQSYGKPLDVVPHDYHLYWQTNGMGNAYWSAPAAATGNVLRAIWSPTNDVGARVYNCFVGSPYNIYHAAFQLRLRPSPGALPNVLPLPVPVIDFAKVRVLNPPWSGGGGGIDTNAVRDIIHATVDGAARPLPNYLHALDFDDSYPDAAQDYYRSRGNGKVDGGCSAVRDGGFLYRNFDYPFDDRSEFVVRMSAGPNRFASVGVAQVGTNLTEQIVTSGKPSHWYKALPGATVDGINENGVAAEINVVYGDPQTSGWHTTGDLHPLAAIRWILDHATNALHGAEYIAANIRFPQGWTQNFHYMIADEMTAIIVENGSTIYSMGPPHPEVLTNYKLPSGPGGGVERHYMLSDGVNITNAWYTNAYRRETNPPWVSDLAPVIAYTNEIFNAWASHPKEYFRNKTNNGEPWWQTVHTSVYDITNRVLRVSVQETDDWYTFQVPATGGGVTAERDPVALPRVAALETEVAAIPRITESNDHGGYARYADIALDADYAAEARKADEVGGYGGSDLDDMYETANAALNAATDANDKADVALSSADAAQAHSEATRVIVTTWESFLDGSNVVFSITNYLSGTYNLDAAKLRITELRDGAYREVYNSREEILLHIDHFANSYVRVALDAVVEEVAQRLADKADRAWGNHTSAGGNAPSNTVYMTAPNTVFAGGMEYERVAVGQGAVCVLTTKGAPVYTQGDEGTFKFQDDGGTNYFGFAKTDSYVIGCNTDGISVQNQILTLEYDVTMSGVPCIWYRESLQGDSPWVQCNTPDGEPISGAPKVVQWDENPGAGKEICYINCSEAIGFFKATIEVAGEAKFMTNMKADLNGGVLCTDGQTVIYPHPNGTWSTTK